MRREHGLADEFRFPFGLVARAQRVIEYDHTRSSRLAPDQELDLRIVDGLQLLGVEKVGYLGWVRDKDKPLLIERQPITEQSAVLNRHPLPVVAAGAAAPNIVGAEGLVDELLAAVCGIGDFNSDRFRHNDSFLIPREA